MLAERQQDTERLLRVLREPSEDVAAFRDPSWDWRGFAAACDLHNVASVVFCRLRNPVQPGMPPGLMEHLQSRFLERSTRSYYLAKKLAVLLARFEEERIPVLVYKGPAVAIAAYGDLALREFDDIDLIVRREDVVRAVDAMRRGGFESVPQGGRPHIVPEICSPDNPKHLALAEEIPFRSPDGTYFVDLHWSLGHDYWRAFSPDIEKVWANAETLNLPQGEIATFCREDLFLALCAHGTKHRWLRLKWLVDIAQLLRKSELMDWSRVEETIRARPGVGISASLATLLTEDLLGVPATPDAMRVLPITQRTRSAASTIREEILSNGQTDGSYYRTLLELEERPLQRTKIRANVARRYPIGISREIFAQVSSKDRALIQLPHGLRFLYHVVRPVRLMFEYSRRAARTFTNSAS